MPKIVKQQEREQRIRRGRRTRYRMEEKAISYGMLMRHFKKSRNSIWLALRAGKMPTLLDKIESFVEVFKPKIQ